MLRWRLLSALVIISVLLGFICLDYWHPWGAPTGLWLLPLLLLATVLDHSACTHFHPTGENSRECDDCHIFISRLLILF